MTLKTGTGTNREGDDYAVIGENNRTRLSIKPVDLMVHPAHGIVAAVFRLRAAPNPEKVEMDPDNPNNPADGVSLPASKIVADWPRVPHFDKMANIDYCRCSAILTAFTTYSVAEAKQLREDGVAAIARAVLQYACAAVPEDQRVFDGGDLTAWLRERVGAQVDELLTALGGAPVMDAPLDVSRVVCGPVDVDGVEGAQAAALEGLPYVGTEGRPSDPAAAAMTGTAPGSGTLQ